MLCDLAALETLQASQQERIQQAAAKVILDDPDVPEDEIRLGSGTLTDMTWKQMVDTATCTECGRCQDVCPAYATGKELSRIAFDGNPELSADDNDGHIYVNIEDTSEIVRNRRYPKQGIFQPTGGF